MPLKYYIIKYFWRLLKLSLHSESRHVARGDAGDAQRPLAEFRASPGGFLIEK